MKHRLTHCSVQAVHNDWCHYYNTSTVQLEKCFWMSLRAKGKECYYHVCLCQNVIYSVLVLMYRKDRAEPWRIHPD